MTGFAILWRPGAASEDVARANLAVPLLLLGVANALPSYVLLLRYGATQLIQLKLDTTPGGMFPTSIFFFTAFTWASPFLLPLAALAAAWVLTYYVGFFLDTKVQGSELRRLVAWGFLPFAIQKLLAGIIVLACGRECDLFNPLATNLAFFLDSKQTDVFWYEMARGLELFALWAIVIAGRAIATRYERSASAVIIGIAALYLIALFAHSSLLG